MLQDSDAPLAIPDTSTNTSSHRLLQDILYSSEVHAKIWKVASQALASVSGLDDRIYLGLTIGGS